jgi:pimeloyl-ACP methyl ester carboxylesterase
MKWLWLSGAVILAVAAVAVWYAFQRPDFVAGLVAVATAAAWKALAPAIVKRKSADEEAIWRDAIREGMAGTDQRRGTGPSSK